MIHSWCARLVMCVFALSELCAYGQQSTHGLALKPHEKVAINEGKAPSRNQKVRIALSITELKPGGLNAQSKRVFAAGRVWKHTLRADILKKNHFYLGNFHVISEPQSWVKANGLYRTRLTILKRYGDYQQLEELMGYMDVDGRVVRQEKEHFRLMASSTKRFFHPSGEPQFDFMAGFSAKPQPMKNFQAPANMPPLAKQLESIK